MLCKPKRFGRFLVRSGDLKHRITIQRKEIKPPPTGVDVIENFIDVVTVYAAIVTPSPKAPFDDINTTELVTHQFFIRYIEGITLDNWVLHQIQRYRLIQIVNVDNLNEWVRLDCNIKGPEADEGSKW